MYFKIRENKVGFNFDFGNSKGPKMHFLVFGPIKTDGDASIFKNNFFLTAFDESKSARCPYKGQATVQFLSLYYSVTIGKLQPFAHLSGHMVHFSKIQVNCEQRYDLGRWKQAWLATALIAQVACRPYTTYSMGYSPVN